jgi:hypothetical protein
LPAKRTAPSSGSVEPTGGGPSGPRSGGGTLCAGGFGRGGGLAVPAAFLAVEPERAVFAPAFARAVFARAAFARVEGDAFAVELAEAVFADAVAPPRDAPPRLSLRCPGRDRGRLPRTPGSSLLSAATREK